MELFSSSTVCLKSLFRNEFLHLPTDDKDEPKVDEGFRIAKIIARVYAALIAVN